jgi:MoaA/NifB/PqqE/SkfB family radical SAM enzyme
MKLINNLLWANNNNLSQKEYLARHLVLRSKPQFLIIDPTSRCNARCVMCYQSFRLPSEHGEDLPLSVYNKVKSIMPMASHINLFSTGEPSLAKEIVFFLRDAQRRSNSHAPIYLATNGKSLPPEVLDCLLTPQMVLQFSVDGGTKEVFESIRRGIAFEEICRTLQRVDNLKKGGNYPALSFSSTISKRNIHDIGAIFALAKRFNVEQVLFYDEDPEVPEEEAYVLDESDRSLFNTQLPFIEKTGIRHYNGLFFKGKNRETAALSSHGKGQAKLNCAAPWKVFHLHADGSVRTCCTLRESMGNLKEATFEEIWNGEGYTRLRQAFVKHSDIPSSCFTCTDPLREWGVNAVESDH